MVDHSNALIPRRRVRAARAQSELAGFLNEVAADLRRRVLVHGAALEELVPGFSESFVKPMEGLSAIEFAKIDGGAAFTLDRDSSLMLMNVDHAIAIAQAADLDLRDDVLRDAKLDDKEVGALLRLSLYLLILHEVRHSSQGVADFADIQRLKNIVGGDMAIGQLDLLADCDAARAYAALRTIEIGDASRPCGRISNRDSLGL